MLWNRMISCNQKQTTRLYHCFVNGLSAKEVLLVDFVPDGSFSSQRAVSYCVNISLPRTPRGNTVETSEVAKCRKQRGDVPSYLFDPNWFCTTYLNHSTSQSNFPTLLMDVYTRQFLPKVELLSGDYLRGYSISISENL